MQAVLFQRPANERIAIVAPKIYLQPLGFSSYIHRAQKYVFSQCKINILSDSDSFSVVSTQHGKNEICVSEYENFFQGENFFLSVSAEISSLKEIYGE